MVTWWARPDSNRGPSGFPNFGAMSLPLFQFFNLKKT